MVLSEIGEHTSAAIAAIQNAYPGVVLDAFCIMPNHVHLLITLSGDGDRPPNLSRIVQQTKRRISATVGEPIWQSHYHDHVVRNEKDYRDIRQYIENNPAKWTLDLYFRET